MQGPIIYKCQLCGCRVEYTTTNDVAAAVHSIVVGSHMRLKYYVTHTCKDGCTGVCTLIGGGIGKPKRGFGKKK